MVDPKDRQNRGSLSVVTGTAESMTPPVAGPMPAPGLEQGQPSADASIVPTHQEFRPPNGLEDFTQPVLSPTIPSVAGMMPTNPIQRELGGLVIYTKEEFDRMSGGNWKIGGTGMGIVGSRQTDREEELKKAA